MKFLFYSIKFVTEYLHISHFVEEYFPLRDHSATKTFYSGIFCNKKKHPV
jgi:hypothetical protein